MNGQLYVFSGPSGAGKSTVIKELKKRIGDLEYSVSHTSRLPRKNEKNGIDYHFVDKKNFKRMIDKGEFVEWAKVYKDYYGTSRSSLNDRLSQSMDIILDVDSQGAKNIRESFNNILLIYILPPSLETLEKRLRSRAMDDDSVIKLRIKQARKELEECRWYDYMIINEDLEKAVHEAESIIIAHRCSKSRVFPKIKDTFRL